MTDKTLLIVKEGEENTHATIVSKLLNHDMISDAGVISLNGVKQLLLLFIRFVIRVSRLFTGRANLPQL